MAEKFVLKDLFSLILIFRCLKICVKGMVTLSPGPVTPVCQVGDQLELTCSTNGSFLRWVFTVGNEQGVPWEYQRNINSLDGPQQRMVIELNSTTFTTMRTSDQGVSPLVSALVINSVSNDLNGTAVHRQDVGTSMRASTIIQLFNVMTNCGYFLLPAENDSKPTVMYSGLPIEGATVNFTCPAGLKLTGTNSATCMRNGEWEPDPQVLECIKSDIFNCNPPSPPSSGYTLTPATIARQKD